MSAAVPDPERAVVGAVLLAATPAEAARLMATAGDLEAGHFRHSLAGAAWRAERELVQAGRLPDAVSIAAALARVNGRGNPHAFVGSLLDGLPHVGDLAQWASLIRNEAPAGERSGCAWARAVAAPEFCAGSEADIAWIERPFLAPGVVTLWFSPRGLGKTLIAHEMAVRLAQRGKRVLLIDRDNPRAETRRRLRRWGATDAPLLRVLGRDGAPPLTDVTAWAKFPSGEYDVVMVDSLDSSTEGVGEQDSARPSRALACMLDIAHAANGPSFLVLGNVIKSGTHGRGSGVIEDRSDVVFEVRDATDFAPTGRKAWWEELPAAGRADWAPRAGRRRKRTVYRLAFISSKFRISDEPEPFVFEVDLSRETWAVRDVTADVVQAGDAAQAETVRQREEAHALAQAALVAEIERRAAEGAAPLTRRSAEEWLTAKEELTRKAAREAVKDGAGRLWREAEGTPGVHGGAAPWLLLPPHETELAAVTTNPADPRQLWAKEAPVRAALDGSGRPQPTVKKPALMAAENGLELRPLGPG